MTIIASLKNAVPTPVRETVAIFSVLMTGTMVPLFIIGWVFVSDQLYVLFFVPVTVYVAFTHPKGWMLREMFFGQYRCMPRQQITARVISSHATKSYTETRSICSAATIGWPYGGWYTFGERFLVVRLVHAGKRIDTAIKVNKTTFAKLKPGDRLKISCQFSRGPNESQEPVLARIVA